MTKICEQSAASVAVEYEIVPLKDAGRSGPRLSDFGRSYIENAKGNIAA
jgi:hypothetical protein